MNSRLGLRANATLATLAFTAILVTCGCDGTGPIPTVGGETGDPGVSGPGPFDFTTAMVNEQDGPGGSCLRPPATSTVRRQQAYAHDRSLHHDVLLASLADGRLITAERRFGVSIIAQTEDGELEPGPALLIDAEPLAMREVAPARVLLLTASGALLVDVSSAAPVKLDETSWPGVARDGVIVPDSDALAMMVVADEYTTEYNICSSRSGTALHGLSVADGALEGPVSLALGRDVTSVALLGNRAVIAHVPDGVDGDALPEELSDYWDFEPVGPSELQLVELAGDGTLDDRGVVASVAGAVMRAGHLRLDDNALDVVSAFDQSFQGDGDGNEDTQDDDETSKPQGLLTRLDLSDPTESPLSSCTFPYVAPYEAGSVGRDDQRSAVFLSDGAVVVDTGDFTDESEPSRGRVVHMGDADVCAIDELVLPPAAIPLITPDGRLLVTGREPASQGTSLSIAMRLFDTAAPSQPLASLSLPLDDRERNGRVFDLRILSQAVASDGAAGALEQTLLAVPHYGFDEESAEGAGVEFVSLSEDSLTARGGLEGAADVADVGGTLYGLLGSRLTALTLDSEDLPEIQADGEPWPRGGAIARLPKTLAQLQYEAGAHRVELLAMPLYPHQVLGTIEVSESTDIFAVGERLVTIEAEGGCGQGDKSHIRVFDVHDPAEPRELGALVTGEFPPCQGLSMPDAYTWGGHVFGDQLVLRSRRDTSRGDERFPSRKAFSFHIIDLRDPASPAVMTLERPATEHGLHALLQDGVLYYSYGLPVEDAAEPTYAVFLVTIDLTDEGGPLVSEPVNVPGTVIAASGDAVYTRSARWQDDAVYSLQRVAITATGAEIRATLDTGAQFATSAHVSDGQLLVTLAGGPGPMSYWHNDPTRLLVLDEDDLSTLAELPLANHSTIVGIAGDHLIAYGDERIQLVRSADPDAAAVVDEIHNSRPLLVGTDGLYYLHGSYDGALVHRPL